MTRRAPPPRPTSVLSRLLQRFANEVRRLPFDPDLPHRVERQIRTARATPDKSQARVLPRWAVAAAALLLALGAGTSAGSRPAAVCGPIEAEQRWEEARATRDSPWPVRVRAYRAVLDEAHRTDRLHRRAIERLARTLRKAHLVHGATALEAMAAGLGPERDRGRLGSLLTQARGLRDEGDRAAATPVIEEVATLARAIAPTMADRARGWQADDAIDADDLERLEELACLLAREDAGLHVRLEMTSAIGCLRLDRGDEKGARAALTEARRLYEHALKRDDKTAARCAKLWLDLKLRERLRQER